MKLKSFFQTYLVLSCFTLGMFFTACKKKNVEYIINGKVVDKTLAATLVNTDVKMEGLIGSNSSYTEIAILKTDANANFIYTLPRQNYSSIRFTVVHPNYFSTSKAVNIVDLSSQKSNNIEVDITAKSWARFVFINDANSASNQFNYIKQKGKVNCEGCCPALNQTIFSATGGSYFCSNDGNTPFSILYSSTGKNPEIREITTQAFDTTETIIHY